MSFEEIRTAFLNYYEKRQKMLLLKSELDELQYTAAQIANVDHTNEGNEYSPASYELTVINSVLSDTYSILIQNSELLRSLNQVRSKARSANNEISMFMSRVGVLTTNHQRMVSSHNTRMKQQSSELIESCKKAVNELSSLTTQ